MLFRGVILEGVACAGKTSVLRALTVHPAFQSLSSIVLTEHHTQRVLEARAARAELGAADNIALLQNHADYFSGLHERLAGMDRWRKEDLPNPRLRVVLERFHLTHVTSYAHLAWEDVEALDARLASMDFSLVLLRQSRAELQRRLVGRGPHWAEQVDHLLRQQDEMLALAHRSRLPYTELPTETIAERVLELLA